MLISVKIIVVESHKLSETKMISCIYELVA